MTADQPVSSRPDHGGGVDAAAAKYGGPRGDWIDLSTGINPAPYPVPPLPAYAWAALPDQAAMARLEDAARAFWNVPDRAAVLAASGASALIARIPALATPGRVQIDGPTYNEHGHAFRALGWTVQDRPKDQTDAVVRVHPNNPDGRLWPAPQGAALRVIDESFCDVTPTASLIAESVCEGTLVLKSFGKFWGLAGLRLGFAIGDPALIARLAQMLGPWPVSGPALAIGAGALDDPEWANATRARLADDAARLDRLMTARGARTVGGTTLFRLYDVADALRWQETLARSQIWTRVFPYSTTWLRLGLPAPQHWPRLEAALEDLR
jgi:cobalamin biosynthesis protein CobC